VSADAGDQGRNVCGPCGGSGELSSNLGGSPHRVTCPWCEGTGRFIPGHDAQQAPAEGGGAAPEDGPDD